MAVRERTYRPYVGPRTSRRWRFLAIPRYAYQDVTGSRRFLMVLVASMVYPALAALVVYLRHNAQALIVLNIDAADILAIDGEFFFLFYQVQGFMSWVIVFLVGPTLVSTDLAHNALPLYLARPISRAEYVLGKLAVMAILVSLVTWVPGLILFLFQALLEGAGWAVENWWLGLAILNVGWVTILALSLPTLAISALVRWHVMARGAVLGLPVFLGIVAGVVHEIVRSEWASVLNPARMLLEVWAHTFRVPVPEGVPAWAAGAVIALMCGASVLLLWRKVKAYEVVG